MKSDIFRQFTGSIPEYYDRYLVPLMFEPYAQDLVKRLNLPKDASILELACGTGAVTQILIAQTGFGGRVVATDLNPDMLDRASRKLAGVHNIQWSTVDATKLPYGDKTFDAVVCQFGWMFFPDRLQAAREARRVLRDGGCLLFNTWNNLVENPVHGEAYRSIRACFSSNPPSFYEVPYGMSDPAEHRRLLNDAGLTERSIEIVNANGATFTADEVATGIIRGGPFVLEIEERSGDVNSVVSAVAGRLSQAFGPEITAPLSALVVTAQR